MSITWRPMSDYVPGTKVLFWIDDGFAQYAVVGVQGADPDDPTIWDDNDYGYDGTPLFFADWTPPPSERLAS